MQKSVFKSIYKILVTKYEKNTGIILRKEHFTLTMMRVIGCKQKSGKTNVPLF